MDEGAGRGDGEDGAAGGLEGGFGGDALRAEAVDPLEEVRGDGEGVGGVELGDVLGLEEEGDPCEGECAVEDELEDQVVVREERLVLRDDHVLIPIEAVQQVHEQHPVRPISVQVLDAKLVIFFNAFLHPFKH